MIVISGYPTFNKYYYVCIAKYHITMFVCGHLVQVNLFESSDFLEPGGV